MIAAFGTSTLPVERQRVILAARSQEYPEAASRVLKEV